MSPDTEQMMKLRCTAAALLLAIPLFANASGATGFFLDGALGRASNNFGGSDNTVSLIDFGYRWSQFGLDLGYVDMSRANSPLYKDQQGVVPQIFQFGSKESGLTLDASRRWQFGNHWYFDVRAGLYSWHNTFYEKYYAPAVIHSKSRQSAVSWNGGIGVGYNVNDKFSVGLRWDAYHGGDDTTTPLSLMAELRF